MRQFAQAADRIYIGNRVDLAGTQDHGPFGERGIERRQLPHEDFKVVNRVASGFRDVYQMDEQVVCARYAAETGRRGRDPRVPLR